MIKNILIVLVALTLFACPSPSESENERGGKKFVSIKNYIDDYDDKNKVEIEIVNHYEKIGSGRMGEWLPDAKITYYDSIIPNDFHDGYYEGDFTEPNVGESVNVEIEHTDFNFTGSVDYPNEVTITSPTLSQYNSFINDNASEIVITWDEVVPNPDSLEVFIPGIDTIENEEVRITLPGNATSYTIPAGILDFRGFVVTVCISSLNRMDFDTEVYDEESNFELLNISRVFIKAN